MGCRFSGFFVDTDDLDLVEAVQTSWSIVTARRIHTPFSGFGFAFPDHEGSATDEEAEVILEAQYVAHDALPQIVSFRQLASLKVLNRNRSIRLLQLQLSL